MKKIKLFFIFLALLLIPFTGNAQPTKNEISVEYGYFTVPQAAYVFGGVFGVIFTLGNFNFDNTIMTGALGVEYNRNINSWFGYGGVATVEYMTSDTFTTDSEGNKTKNGVFKLGATTLMPSTHFFWFRNPHFGMYSKLGAGIGLTFGSEQVDVFPAFQVSPVCMEFGGDTYKGVFELGVGTQGIATLGIKKLF